MIGARYAQARLTPLVTPALFLEYEAVLKRPEERLAHGLTVSDVDRFLAALASACEAVDVSFQCGRNARTRTTRWSWRRQPMAAPMQSSHTMCGTSPRAWQDLEYGS